MGKTTAVKDIIKTEPIYSSQLMVDGAAGLPGATVQQTVERDGQ